MTQQTKAPAKVQPCLPPMKEQPAKVWYVFGYVDFTIGARARYAEDAR